MDPAGRRLGAGTGNGAEPETGSAVIPIADSNPIRRIPVVTLVLIATCVVVYFAIQPTGAPRIQWDAVVERVDEDDLRFVVDNAAIPCELVKGRPLTEREFQHTFGNGRFDSSACRDAGGRSHSPDKAVFLAVLTSMFLHGSIAHLFGNMLFLWVFGNNVEHRAGWWRYLLLYLVGGAVATAAHVAIGPNSTVPIIGASGAIAAVVGAYFVLWPSTRIKTIIVILPVFLRKVMALWLLVVWVGQQFLFVGADSGVAWAAHIGGFAFGALVGLWWRFQDHRRSETSTPFAAAPAPV
jgi:membrane associated rhomboid family serine protease